VLPGFDPAYLRRREFIASMGGSAVSRAVRAQQSPQEYALM
jgi:hypothetical protein